MAKNTYKLKKINKKERIDIAIAIAVILLCALLIYFYAFRTTDAGSVDLDAIVEPLEFEKVPPLEEIVIAGDLYRAQRQEPFTQQEIVDTLFFVSSTVATGVASEVETYADTTKADKSGLKTQSIPVLSEELSNEVESTEDDTDDLESLTAPIAPMATAEVITQKEQTKCVIILGAFRNSKNISSLLAELGQSGYDAFTVPYKGLTRVGVNVSCDDSVNGPVLEKLRKAIANDAVLMKNVPNR